MSTLSTFMNVKISQVRPDSADYLKTLVDISNPVKTLYYRGRLPSARRPTVAIVGSRKPTNYGREVTSQLAAELSRHGVVVVSGLALGIDAIAHQVTLDSGGTTIAVLASGLHEISPRSNRQLAEAILANGGAIVSEYAPGVEAMRYNFLARNRIVSGLSDAIIVTEAAARSGTLNTAMHALEQGRTVYAVPGNITSPLSVGCNRLIAQGAQPLLDTDEILSELLPEQSGQSQSVLPLGNSELESFIIQALASGQRDGEQILALSQATVADFNNALSMLEINGAIKPLGANQWSLR